MIQTVGILGGCGGFGRLFSRHLQQAGKRVVSIDVNTDADVVCDVMADAQPLLAAAAGCELLLLCVPETLALRALESLDGQVHSGQLLVDICSVKSNISSAAQKRCAEAEYLSIHPMFGPDRGMAGNNLVVIPLRRGVLGESFTAMLAGWQLQLVETDAATHDRVTSLVQVLAHATLISFAQAQSRMPVPDDLVQAMATPIYTALSDTAQGLLGENPNLYHNIQTANPAGEAARQALREAVEATTRLLGQEDAAAVERLFQQLRWPGRAD